MKLKLLITIIAYAMIFSQFGFAQSNYFWTKNERNRVPDKIVAGVKSNVNFYSLDLNSLKVALLDAPDIASKDLSGMIRISFPNAEGRIQDFLIAEASVLPRELKEKYPGIYSYAGYAINDPATTIRFSLSDYSGVSGIILGSEMCTFIEPISKGEIKDYKIYSQPDTSFKFECETSELGKKVHSGLKMDAGQLKATDPLFRTYRVAILADYPYGDYFAGTGTDQQKKANILSHINSTITLINAVYERDLAVRLQLVPNNDKIIFFTGIPAPAGSDVPDIINDSIGFGNYEIGHTLGRITDPEFEGLYKGNAGCIGCICTEDKGLAWSMAYQPETPVFAMVIAHEMGHQMGAYHVQSSADCISGNGKSEVEPGSGSTIMGYAGICSPNVEFAPHSYFNQISIRQIDSYIYTLSCGAFSNPGNAAPTANAGPDYIIPKLTPFVLTGQGTDSNGDNVTYTWEQNDPQIYDDETLEDPRNLDRGYPAPFKSSGPMFRSYPPTSSPVRILPNLTTVLNNGPYLFEVLPSVTRDLNFVLTVRDNHPGGGRIEFDSMKVRVIESAGPFDFSSSIGGLVWQSGSTQSVSWNVAGTNTTPINCQNVRILLSIDGGLSFPYVLNSGTPNDGSENVTLPSNVSSAKCRMKIEAVNNIFFAISKDEFAITTGGCYASIPDSLHIQSIGTTTTLAWIRGNNPDYEIRYRVKGSGSWNYQSATDKPGNYIMWENLNGLTPSTTYETQVRSICDGQNTITVRARGTTGQEHINLKVNNNTIGSINLTTTFQNYTFNTTQTGGIIVQYDNDQGSRDVVVDYVEVNGQIRQAEAQSTNTAAYGNGRCGGGSYTEWMNCNGYIGFDNVSKNNITIRARGTSGGEHINLRINNNVIANFNLTTSFQNYNATFTDNGGITVQFDNDKDNSDVVLDYIIVNGDLRQSEDQSYNTATFGNGTCGGISHSEWMHCNGLIGFGEANSSGTGTSGWSDTLVFSVISSEYHADDINVLLGINEKNDVQDNLDWFKNPNPADWYGLTWTTVPPKRVLHLSIAYTGLTGELYAGGLPAMTKLYVGNDITSLNINGSSALETLVCNDGLIDGLDLSTQYNLKLLDCRFNLIRQINFGTINQIKEIKLLSNQLTTINLSNLNKLVDINIDDNYLTSLNVNGCDSLEWLNCENNEISSIQIEGLSKLSQAFCESNHITNASIKNLPALKHLILSYNDLNDLSGLSNIPALWNLYVDNNKITNLVINNLPELIRLDAQRNTISSVSGLSGVPNLGTLYISQNNLTSLNLTSLSKVGVVEAYFNKLTDITLPSPSMLRSLDVWGNYLTNLNLVGQDSLEILIADSNQLESFTISGTRASIKGVGASMNNLLFTELIKVSDAIELRIDPMHEVFDSVLSMTDVTINYSSQAMIEGQPTTFRWFKNNAFVSSNTSGVYATSGNGIYYCEMQNGHFPDFTLTSAPTIIGDISTPICGITVPVSSPLPSVNTSYNHMHVVGAGPSLSHIVNFTINWSLPNNGLWDMAFNTNNGNPAWYVNLLGKVSQTFASANPSLTISGSGISGLDGAYWVRMDGSNFVMASKSGNYIIYCSNSSVPPCTKVTDEAVGIGESLTESIRIYPNPASTSLYIELPEMLTSTVSIYSMLGELVVNQSSDASLIELDVTEVNSGIYILKVLTEGQEFTQRIIIGN